MKKCFLILFISHFCFSISAQTLTVLDFKETNSADARILKETDRNDQPCALLKVSSAIEGMTFDSSLGICKVANKNGEYWVYLSPKERRLDFFNKKYEKLSYTFNYPIEKLKTYELTLRGDVNYQTNIIEKADGVLLIESTPSGAKVYINNDFTGLYTPFQKTYKAGIYEITLKKDLHIEYKDTVQIDYEQTKKVKANLIKDYTTVKIETVPNGATVSIDGNKESSLTPLNVKLKTGKHNITFEKEKYNILQKEINITKGNDTVITADLEQLFGVLELDYPYTKATLEIDNVVTKGDRFELIYGLHKIKITQKYHQPYMESINIEKNKTLKKKITLVPNKGKIQILTKPFDADIYIDSKKMGKSPGSFEVNEGYHKVEVSKDNMYGSSSVFVKKNKVTQENITLKIISSKKSPANTTPNDFSTSNTETIVYESSTTATVFENISFLGGLTYLSMGIYYNYKGNKEFERYKNDFSIPYDNVDAYKQKRNISYWISGGLFLIYLLIDDNLNQVNKSATKGVPMIKSYNMGITPDNKLRLTVNF